MHVGINSGIASVLDDAFQVEDMGVLPLKNVAQPVRVCRLCSEELEPVKR